MGGSLNARRGQTGVMGVVLLFVIVLVVSATVVTVGGAAIRESQTVNSVESATMGMNQLDSTVSSAGGPESSQTVSMPELDGEVAKVEETAGRVIVRVDSVGDGSEEKIIDEDLGRVVTETEGVTVAYQAGGVWRTAGSGSESVMVSPPNMEYRYRNGEPTMSLPLPLVRGETDGESVELTRISQQSEFADLKNPIASGGSMTVEIRSEFYRAWGRLFEQRTDGTVTYDHGTRTVTLSMEGHDTVSGGGAGTVDSALATGSSASITNVGSIDSYDSSNGGYPGWRNGEDAVVGVDGDFEASSSPTISGDLNVTGRMWTSNDLEVYGDTYVGGSPGDGTVDRFDGGSQTIHGTFSTQDDLEVTDGKTFKGDVIAGGQLQPFRADTVEGSIHAGDDADLDAHSVTVNVHGDVYVDGDLHVHSGAVTFHGGDSEIHATGDVYVQGSSSLDADVYAGNDVVLESGSPTVTGEVHAGNDADSGLTDSSDTYEGASATAPTEPRSPPAPTVDAPPPATTAIADNRSKIAGNNDNGDAPISAIETNAGGSNCGSNDCVLESGRYYLDQMQIVAGSTASDPALELDTSDGDIELFVKNDIVVKDEIEVTGPNQVRVYSDGDLTVESSDAAVRTPDDNASQFWVFMKPGHSANFQSGSPLFTGVVYGPGPSAGSGVRLGLTNAAEIRGALLGKVDGFNSDVEVHYDEELSRWAPIGSGGTAGSGPPDADSIAYFRTSTTTIEATD